MATVSTVTGPVSRTHLGRVNYHEHVFQETPLLRGDELDDPTASAAEIRLLRLSGFDAMIDATPIGLGRRSAQTAEISHSTGLQIVATTGRHRDEHYKDSPFLALTEDDLTQIFERELTVGMAQDDRDYLRMPVADVPVAQVGGRTVLAGVGKVGIGFWRISRRERDTIAALARAHSSTGMPIMIHTEYGSATHEVLDLFASLGVIESRIVLAHVDRNPDPALLGSLAQRGAYLGFDGAARLQYWPESTLQTVTAELVDEGHVSRILLGGDVARATRYEAYGGMPGLAYLGNSYVPRLRALIGTEATERILRDNPARFLTGQP